MEEKRWDVERMQSKNNLHGAAELKYTVIPALEVWRVGTQAQAQRRKRKHKHTHTLTQAHAEAQAHTHALTHTQAHAMSHTHTCIQTMHMGKHTRRGCSLPYRNSVRAGVEVGRVCAGLLCRACA